MADEITNTVANETPVVAPATTEENVQANQEPQTTTQENVDGSTVENSNQEQEVKQEDVQDVQQPEQVKQPTVEELQSKLKEYEVREEEDRMIREQLGIQDVDSQTYSYMNLDQQVVNEGKQVYLRLCNEYGIDANPDKIDASVNALKQSDPAKAYEFQRRFENLSNEVSAKRNAIQQQNTVYEINKFSNEYNELLNASPALNNIMTQYVQNYGRNTTNMYGQLHGVMDVILPAYKEAFEAGKRFALQDKAKQDTSAVSGGVATVNTQTYTPGTTFTRDQIGKMSSDEFAKYEKEIRQQMLEGKII